MSEQPLPSFHFSVEWGGKRISFSEVSGLNIEVQTISYREGADKEYTIRKMPGLVKYSNITLKRGIMQGDNDFFEWLNTITMNKVERRDLVISLLNEEHEPVVVWKAKDAFPVKIEGPELKAEANEVAIESMEIAHEGLTIQNG